MRVAAKTRINPGSGLYSSLFNHIIKKRTCAATVCSRRQFSSVRPVSPLFFFCVVIGVFLRERTARIFSDNGSKVENEMRRE